MKDLSSGTHTQCIHFSPCPIAAALLRIKEKRDTGERNENKEKVKFIELPHVPDNSLPHTLYFASKQHDIK